MGYRCFEVDRVGAVATVRLSRPDELNTMTPQFWRELPDVVGSVGRDGGVRAVVLASTGRHFCAGMDLSEVSAGTVDQISDAQERLFTMGFRAEKPIVAAVEGASLGGWMGLVGNCHIVVAHPEATFGLTEIRVGLWPFLVHRALSAAIGERRVLELALTGRVFGTQEAKEMGLVQEVAGSPRTRAAEIASAVSEFSPDTLRSGLRFTREVRGQDWETAGQTARRMRDEVFASGDFQEGLRAFREKRHPQWPSVHRPYQL